MIAAAGAAITLIAFCLGYRMGRRSKAPKHWEDR